MSRFKTINIIIDKCSKLKYRAYAPKVKFHPHFTKTPRCDSIYKIVFVWTPKFNINFITCCTLRFIADTSKIITCPRFYKIIQA